MKVCGFVAKRAKLRSILHTKSTPAIAAELRRMLGASIAKVKAGVPPPLVQHRTHAREGARTLLINARRICCGACGLVQALPAGHVHGGKKMPQHFIWK